jgi:hypothetical protein
MKRRTFLAALLSLPFAQRLVGRTVASADPHRYGPEEIEILSAALDSEMYESELYIGRVVGVVRMGPGGRERIHRVKVLLPARRDESPIEVYATPVESLCGPISGRKDRPPLQFDPGSTVVVAEQNGEYFVIGSPRYELPS